MIDKKEAVDMQQDTQNMRADRVVFHTKEEVQLQGRIELEADQSDIARVISVTASVVPDGAQVQNDMLEISGRLIFEVLYVSEDASDDVAVLQAQSNFRHSMQTPGSATGMQTRYVIQVEDVEEVLENPRTTSLTADVEFAVWVLDTAQLDMDIQNPQLQVKKQEFAAVETLERQTQAVDILRQAQLPARAPAVSTVIASDAFAVVRDVAGTVEGTHVDGELIVFTAYYDDAQPPQFYTASFNLPFGFDLEWEQRGMGENASVILAVDALEVTPVTDEMGEYRLLDVEARLLANASLWQEIQLQLPVDAYLPGHQTQLQTKQVMLCRPAAVKNTQRMLRFSVTLPGGYPPMEQVIFMRARPIVRSVVDTQDAALAVGVLMCDVVYRAQGDAHAIYGFHAAIPFEERAAFACCAESLQAKAWCLQASATVLDETQVDCRVQLEVEFSCMQPHQTEYVESVRDIAPAQDESAIVMSVATANDDLWSIAKRFNVSLDAVLAANPKYENKPLCVGDKVILYRRIVS
ncbi:MAG: DUF3794 domain-containing protein [Clostridia bacterium]|nr:DUF3794 domain-containing protein [Clostridia bacterium]